MRVLVTGGAGFIGSHLVDALVARGHAVTVVDNLSSGMKKFIAQYFDKSGFEFVQKDLTEAHALDGLLEDVDVVFHFAASVEVRVSSQNPRVDFENNIIATFNVLEAIRKSEAKQLVFPSSVTVFGDAKVVPTPEDYGPLQPVSFYGASKLACEGMASAYTSMYGINSVVYRLANVTGSRGTHGVVRDFIAKLRKTPHRLEIFGDGRQTKSYVHVSDCVDAIMLYENALKPFDVLHAGNEDSTSVAEIACFVVEEMGLQNVEFVYTGGARGWPGDIPVCALDTSRLRKLGWKPRYNSSEAVRQTVRELMKEL